MLNKTKKIVEVGKVHNALSSTTEITGNIVTKDNMRLDGIIRGDITSDKKIVIGDKAVVDGNIRCAILDSLGKIIGNVYCDDKITLRHSSSLKGDISVKSIEIEPGAHFEGSCYMHE